MAIEKKWLPLASDVIKLNEFLKVKQETALAELQGAFDLTSWEDLSKSVMILLLLVNRKRVGEIDTIIDEDFKNKQKLCPDTDIYMSLSETKKICEPIFPSHYTGKTNNTC